MPGLEALLTRVAAGDIEAAIHIIRQTQIHIAEVLAANQRLGIVVAEYERRLAAKEPLMTDDERAELRQRIADNTAAIEAAVPD